MEMNKLKKEAMETKGKLQAYLVKRSQRTNSPRKKKNYMSTNISALKRIMRIMDISEVHFYKLNIHELEDLYRLYCKLIKGEESSYYTRSYAFRLYLEFMGSKLDPIRRHPIGKFNKPQKPTIHINYGESEHIKRGQQAIENSREYLQITAFRSKNGSIFIKIG